MIDSFISAEITEMQPMKLILHNHEGNLQSYVRGICLFQINHGLFMWLDLVNVTGTRMSLEITSVHGTHFPLSLPAHMPYRGISTIPTLHLY